MNETLDLGGSYKLKSFDYNENTDFVLKPDFIPVGWTDTKVPEDIRTVLRRDGIITGHYYGKNLDSERWIEEKNWVYHRRFFAEESLRGKRNILRFEGIDTIAKVYLNGRELLLCSNMFIEHSLDVSKSLLYGQTNVLVIKIISPIKSLEGVDRTWLFPAEDTDRLLLRKSQMNYGWDFCGHCLTGGLWKGVFLDSLDTCRLRDVYLKTEEIGENAVIAVHVETESVGKADLKDCTTNIHIRLVDDDAENNKTAASLTLPAATVAEGVISLPHPKLWWPRPYGEPHLYTVIAELEQDGKIIDRREFSFGVRTVRLLQEKLPEEVGGRSFIFEVNGRKLFIRGANWVPTDCVYGEIKDSDYDFYIRRAVDANLSMLRIWGGGIYESEHFFDLCDKNGILIMQDFMLACGVLPQEKWYLDKVFEEVEQVVKRYRGRTCIVMWSGDNELDEAYRWYDILPQFKTNKVNRVAVANAVKNTDSERPFIVSSPCSPFEDEDGFDDPNSPLQGDMHIYLTRFNPDSEYYYKKIREFIPRFMSEYGFSSLPCRDTFERFNFFGEKLDMSKNPWLGELEEFDGIIEKNDTDLLICATQFTHAQALKYGIEYMRSCKWTCGGLLYWKFNDPIAPNRENMLFPTMMSSVDFLKKPKSVYYYSRRAYEDVILAFREDMNGKVEVCACNETLKSYSGTLKISVMNWHGNESELFTREISINADVSEVLFTVEKAVLVKYTSCGYIKAVFEGEIYLVNRYMAAEIKEWFHVSLPDAGLTATVRRDKSELIVTLKTECFAQDVTLSILDIDAYYSDNCFQMDGGESREIRICVDDEAEYKNRCLSVSAQNSTELVLDLNYCL